VKLTVFLFFLCKMKDMFEINVVLSVLGTSIIQWIIMLSVWKKKSYGIRLKVILTLLLLILFHINKKTLKPSILLTKESRKNRLQNSDSYCKVVGSGWSFFLNKGRHDNLCRLKLPCGLLENGRWGAMTKIKDLQKVLVSKGQTLFSYPSIENGTLGGWIASGSHGSGGTLWRSSFGKVKVWDRKTNDVFDANIQDIFGKDKKIDEIEQYVIIDVEILPHENVLCNKSAFKINKIEDCRHFLEKKSYLRMLQIGRRGIMALLWIPIENYLVHMDPHFGSRTGLYFQADILSIIQSNKARSKEWFEFPLEDEEIFSSKMRLSEANRFTLEPSWFTILFGLLYKNFELFVFDISLTPEQLFYISNRLSDMFTKDFHGRCELRCGKTILFLDICLWYNQCHEKCFEHIMELVGKQYKVKLHRGKFQF
jgi:hypothetical protein